MLFLSLLFAAGNTGWAGAPAASGAPPAATGEAVHLTLADAVALGLRENQTIRSAYLQRIVDKFNLRVAEDQFTPHAQINSSLSFNRNRNVSQTVATINPSVVAVTPIGTQLNFGWTTQQNAVRSPGQGSLTGTSTLNFTVLQPLLKGAGEDANMMTLRQARLTEKINQLTLKTTISETINQIIGSYYQLLQAREQIRIAHESLQRAKDLQILNRDMINAGRMAESEYVQAEADVASQELQVITAENAFDSARLSLLVLLAIDPHTNLSPYDKLNVKYVTIDLEQVLSIAFENRPDYLEQLLTIETSRLSVASAKNGRLWDLSASAGASIPAQGNNTRQALAAVIATKPEVSAGLQLTIPLNDLTSEQTEVQSIIALRKNELQLDQLRTQIDQQVRDAVRSVDVNWRQAKLSHLSADLARKTLEMEQLKMQSGRSSNFQIVSFQRDLVSAEGNELTADITYLQALVTLDQQLGTTLDTWKIQIHDDSHDR